MVSSALIDGLLSFIPVPVLGYSCAPSTCFGQPATLTAYVCISTFCTAPTCCGHTWAHAVQSHGDGRLVRFVQSRSVYVLVRSCVDPRYLSSWVPVCPLI